MTEAIFGLIGVLIGSGITWFQSYWFNKKDAEKAARYLAIRVVCILDKFLMDCVEVVKDDGLNCGERTHNGCLEPQVACPPALEFPSDVDWKSIDSELMYRILSFPSDIEASKGIISATWEFSSPPDFEEWFEERAYWYAQFGLNAYKIADELSKRYGIKAKTYNDWDPVADLSSELDKILKSRTLRRKQQAAFVASMAKKGGAV